MLIRARRGCPWRGNISAFAAVVACMLACWLAGPAQANSPLPGVPEPVAAVQQATTALPAVTTAQPPAVRPVASSPRRSAARATTARAAAAQPAPAEPAPTGVVAAVESGAKPAVSAVENRSKAAVAAADSGANAAASTARTGTQRAASSLEAAPQRAAAAVRAVPSRLVATVEAVAANTLSQLGMIALAVQPAATTPRTAGVVGAPAVTPSSGVVVSRGGTRPTTAAGRAHRAVAGAAPTGLRESGWRKGPSAPAERVGGALADLAAPTSRPSGVASAGASPAAAAITALLGLLGLLIFIARRRGSLIRLRPDWVPAPPFLALPERPG